MKISMWMLMDRLQQYDPEPRIMEGQPVLRSARILSNETVIEKQNVYLAHASEFISGEENRLILVHGQDMILLNCEDMEEALNDIFDAFDFYNSWADGITEEIANGCEVQTIVDKSSSIFHQPLLIYNSGNEIIGCSSEYPKGSLDKEWDNILENRTNTLEFLLNIQKILKEQKNYHEIHHFQMEGTPYPSVYRSLFVNRDWAGRIILLEVFHKLSKGELQLFDYFGELIERWALNSDRIAKLPEETAIFLKLINGGHVVREEIEYRLQMAGWEKEDEKRLIRIEFSQANNEISRSVYLRLERLFPDAFVLFSSEILYLLVDLSISPWENIASRLVPILKQSELSAVVSYPFQDVLGLKDSNEQCALTFCYIPRDAGKIFQCSDHALECIHSFMHSSIPAVMKHPALSALKTYDMENGSALYQTLFEYLRSNCNMAETARKLHLHRNSLLYRLNQIRELTGIHFQEADEREHLLFSFYM